MLWPRWRGDPGFEKNPAEMQPSVVGPVSPLPLDQSRGIRSCERKLASGPLVLQSDVHATIARQHDRLHVGEQLMALFGSQLKVPFNLGSHLGFVHIPLLAKSLGFEACSGNGVCDQESFGALYAPFRKPLIVFRGTSWVGMAFQGQVGVRLRLEILSEILRKGNEDLLLAGKQATIRSSDSGLIGRKINTVQGKLDFQSSKLFRTWRRVLHHDLGGRLGVQATYVAARGSHRDRASGSTGRIQNCSAATPRNAATARGPSTHGHGDVVRTGAGATDGGAYPGVNCRRTRRTRKERRNFRRLLHGEGRHTPGFAALLHLEVRDTGDGRVAPGCQAICVNVRGIVPAVYFAACAAPIVHQCMFGIEVITRSTHAYRLTHHDFARTDGAICRGRRTRLPGPCGRPAAKHVENAEVRSRAYMMSGARLIGIAVTVDPNALTEVEPVYQVHTHVEQGSVQGVVRARGYQILRVETKPVSLEHGSQCGPRGMVAVVGGEQFTEMKPASETPVW